MKKYKQFIMTALLMVSAFLWVSLCVSCGKGVKTEPGVYVAADDSFFHVTQFIMTREEQEIYKHLPSKQEREDFIAEFWNKRDPSPGTEENENRDEYEKRINFANLWFKEGPGKRGWDTDRGRILLQLGFPDERNVRVTTRKGTTWQIRLEDWAFYDYKLLLRFADTEGQGRFILDHYPNLLRSTLENARFTLDMVDRDALKEAFKFDAVFNVDGLLISVPVKKLQFKENEKDGQMEAPLLVEVFVYHNYKQIDHFTKEETVRGEKENLLKQKKITLQLPYSITQPGNYFFEVIIKDPLTGSRYRTFCKKHAASPA